MSDRTDPVVIELNCEAHPSTDTVEIDRADWNGMTPTERAVSIQTMVDEHINTSGGGGWHIADPDDEAAVGFTPTTAVLPLADNRAVAEAVEKWLADPRRPDGAVYYSARDLIARIDAVLTGKEV